jgi:hypothetical protein
MSTRMRRLASFHEAGHVLVNTVLGLRVEWSSCSAKGGRTIAQAGRSDLERAVVLWGGPAAETLGDDVQSRQSWAAQPDYKALRKLSQAWSNRGYELACTLVSEHEPAVRALAAHLETSWFLTGHRCRAIIADPSIQPRRARRSDGVSVAESFA